MIKNSNEVNKKSKTTKVEKIKMYRLKKSNIFF